MNINSISGVSSSNNNCSFKKLSHIEYTQRFNPKVNNFKSTILESKVDTLGGKYPFIFRNGNVKYKEFAISGLLSCLSESTDDNNGQGW